MSAVDLTDTDIVQSEYKGHPVVIEVTRCPVCVATKLWKLLVQGGMTLKDSFKAIDVEDLDAIEGIDVDKAFTPLVEAERMVIEHIVDIRGLTFKKKTWGEMDFAERLYWASKFEETVIDPARDHMLKRMLRETEKKS